jgi:hypothetical protein
MSLCRAIRSSAFYEGTAARSPYLSSTVETPDESEKERFPHSLEIGGDRSNRSLLPTGGAYSRGIFNRAG